MERPDELNLSRQDGKALRQRLEGDALTADDRRVLGQVLQRYFWLLFAVQEARFSLKRLRAMLFGEPPKKRQERPPAQSSAPSGGSGGVASTRRQPSGGCWDTSPRPWSLGVAGVQRRGACGVSS